MAASKMSLKLLVDNKTKKVLFAEAGKDFVDFAFSLLQTLPIGAAANLISTGAIQTTTLGSVGRLYKSVADMGAAYLLPGTDKSDLLRPKVLLPRCADGRELLVTFEMYTCPCPGRCVTVTVDAKAECPQCKQAMATEIEYVLPSEDVGGAEGAGAGAASDETRGFVKGLVTYMVTDGLEVTPITSSITLINRFNARKNVDLAEEVVAVGDDEVRALIEAALRSDTVLSDVFLATKNQEVGAGVSVLSRISRAGRES